MKTYSENLKEWAKNTKTGRLVTLVIGKLLQLVVVLISVSFITFLLMHLAPGDPGTAMYEAAGIIPTEEMLEVARLQLGLDKPLYEQYFSWLIQCLQGDMGTSFSQHDEVLNLISRNIKSTVTLALCILGVTLLVAIPLGIISAVGKGKFPDYIIRYTSFIGISTPNYLMALILTYVFCSKLGWIPVYNPYGSSNALILPIFSLAIGMIGDYTRQVRTLFLEELSKDYVYGARARRLSETKILFYHVMRNTMLPLSTLIAFSLGSLLGGIAIVEVIFSFPGLGNLLIFAVDMRDYPLIQGIVLWIALCYTSINIITDLLYKVFDPRLRKI